MSFLTDGRANALYEHQTLKATIEQVFAFAYAGFMETPP